MSRLQRAQILRLVNTEHFNECAPCGCRFNISVPTAPLGRDISVMCSCEIVRCPDNRLRTWCGERRNAECLGSLCSACHLQGDQTLCSRAGGVGGAATGRGLVGLGVNWETAVCVIAAPPTGIMLLAG